MSDQRMNDEIEALDNKIIANFKLNINEALVSGELRKVSMLVRDFGEYILAGIDAFNLRVFEEVKKKYGVELDGKLFKR